VPHPPLLRTRTGPENDRCPGVRRPWPAARQHGDGDLHLTGRANLQLRALPTASGGPGGPGGPGLLDPLVVADLLATGLIPSPTHELVRNVMASPQTGLGGGRADLRPVVDALDAALCAEPAAVDLSGRFLLVLDDGHGDLLDRPCDLGVVALDDRTAQLRVGPAWGEVVDLGAVPAALLDLVRAFLAARAVATEAGTDPGTVWHVAELDRPLVATRHPDERVPRSAPPPAYGPVPGGEHVAAPDGVLGPDLVDDLVGREPDGTLVVTPWRGVVVPDGGARTGEAGR